MGTLIINHFHLIVETPQSQALFASHVSRAVFLPAFYVFTLLSRRSQTKADHVSRFTSPPSPSFTALAAKSALNASYSALGTYRLNVSLKSSSKYPFATWSP